MKFVECKQLFLINATTISTKQNKQHFTTHQTEFVFLKFHEQANNSKPVESINRFTFERVDFFAAFCKNYEKI